MPSRYLIAFFPLQVGIITQDRYDAIHSISWSENSGTGNEPEMSEKKTKESSFSVSVREAAAMKPTDDNPIKAIVLTGDDVEQLRVL